MNKLKTFENQDFGEIRTTSIDGEPWFVASDVCKALGHSNVSAALERLDKDERSKLNLGRQGETNIINESGFYSLVLGSRKKEAKQFKRWVTHEVLPAIRKTGTYSMQDYKPKATSLGEVASYIKMVSRQMEKQGNSPEQIMQMIDSVNEQFGIQVPKLTIKRPFEQMTIFCIKNE